MKKILFFYFLVYSFRLSATEVDCSKLQNLEKVKMILKTSNAVMYSRAERKTFEKIYPHMRECPTEYLNLDLAASEKENLRSIFIQNDIKNKATVIQRSYTGVDLDIRIEEYQKIHTALFGAKAAYDKDFQLLIKLRDDNKRVSCKTSEVDTKDMGPVRNQQDVGWCYAFASADLLSFYAKKTLSSVDVAILYNNFSREALIRNEFDFSRFSKPITAPSIKELFEKKNPAIENEALFTHDGAYDGGIAYEALIIALQRGVCSEKDLPTPNTENLTLNQIRNAPAYYKIKKEDSDLACIDRLHRASKLFTNLQVNQIEEIIEQSNVNSLLLTLRKKNCQDLSFLPNKKVMINKSSHPRHILETLNWKLDSNEPIALTYKSKMIRKDLDGNHISVVIGRKFNEVTKNCEYKVRNSWGSKIPFTLASKVKHEDGNFWISEAEIRKFGLATASLDE